jgi:hypothetical protein
VGLDLDVDTKKFPSYLYQDTSPRPGKIRVSRTWMMNYMTFIQLMINMSYNIFGCFPGANGRFGKGIINDIGL